MVGGAMIGPQNTALKTTLGPLLNGFVNYEYWLASPEDDVPRRSAISEYLPGTRR
jgi:branched-chain amino acid transport system substrate-binding protein